MLLDDFISFLFLPSMAIPQRSHITKSHNLVLLRTAFYNLNSKFNFCLPHLTTNSLKARTMSILFTVVDSAAKSEPDAQWVFDKCMFNEMKEWIKWPSKVLGEDRIPQGRLGSKAPLDGAGTLRVNYPAGFLTQSMGGRLNFHFELELVMLDCNICLLLSIMAGNFTIHFLQFWQRPQERVSHFTHEEINSQ